MIKMSELPGEPDSPSLIFVPEQIKLQGLQSPVSIGTEARLLLAPEETRDALRIILDPHVRSTCHFNPINPWESEAVPIEQGTEIRPIADPSRHQYWIVQHWRRSFDLQLRHALEIADPGLTPVIGLRNPRPVSSGFVNAHAILNWLDQNLVADSRDVGPKEIASIERTWKLLIDFEANGDPSFRFIKKAISDFFELKRVPARAPIYVVGLFAIIEMLLTTQQDKTTENSLSHQLKEKLSLFGNRFADPIVLNEHFPKAQQMSLKSVVSRLYGYRSKVAHGSDVDFSGGDMQVLESHEAVWKFLRVLVRKLLLQAVSEPALFRDMKSC